LSLSLRKFLLGIIEIFISWRKFEKTSIVIIFLNSFIDNFSKNKNKNNCSYLVFVNSDSVPQTANCVVKEEVPQIYFKI
jgi:hypothetical protein